MIAGEVRVSPDGVVAVLTDRTDPSFRWLATTEADRTCLGGLSRSYWRASPEVADWKVVYTPPRPIGTVMSRDTEYGWEIAIRTNVGWQWVGEDGGVLAEDADEPFDDDDGAWKVLDGPVVGTRSG